MEKNSSGVRIKRRECSTCLHRKVEHCWCPNCSEDEDYWESDEEVLED